MAPLARPRKAARWTQTPQALSNGLELQKWVRNGQQQQPVSDWSRFDIHPDVPTYDDDTYNNNLQHDDWTREETDYMIELYRECNGKWPVVIDQYEYEGQQRTMEDLKARFYGIQAKMLENATPISSMTATDFALHEMLKNFNPAQESSRKKLAEGHLYRRANEVDEETVLLGELQRIMLNQATLDSQREELRTRLDSPSSATNGYGYNTSESLTRLWQTLLQQDRLKKNPRLRPTGNPAIDGLPMPTPTSARPRDSIAGQSDITSSAPARRPTRDSLPSATSQGALPVDLSKADQLRFGVIAQNDKLPSGITFGYDRTSKPRVAKSTIQSDKIAGILNSIGIPDVMPMATPPVVEHFDQVMKKVHDLIELRKIREKEEQELAVRKAELASLEAK